MKVGPAPRRVILTYKVSFSSGFGFQFLSRPLLVLVLMAGLVYVNISADRTKTTATTAAGLRALASLINHLTQSNLLCGAWPDLEDTGIGMDRCYGLIATYHCDV